MNFIGLQCFVSDGISKLVPAPQVNSYLIHTYIETKYNYYVCIDMNSNVYADINNFVCETEVKVISGRCCQRFRMIAVIVFPVSETVTIPVIK